MKTDILECASAIILLEIKHIYKSDSTTICIFQPKNVKKPEDIST
mgnify:CR=1 FL=1